MKKLFLVALMAAVSVTGFAQDKYYGSKQGGFAISVNANPFLNYAGNMFNGTQNNSLSDFEGVSNKLFSGVTMTGKYMLKDNIGVTLGLGWDNNYTTSYSFNDPDDVEKRTDLSRNSTTAFMLKVGGEYLLRPGQRLQPILGLDLVYVHENGWNYKESFESVNGSKTCYSYTGAPVNKLGVMAHLGVEYFVCPNISLGAVVSLGVAKVWNRTSHDSDIDGDKSWAKYNSNNVTLKTGNVSNAGANVSLNFYF